MNQNPDPSTPPPEPPPSDTPRVDALSGALYLVKSDASWYAQMRDFARELEREAAALRGEVDEWNQIAQQRACECAKWHENSKLLERLIKIQGDRDEAKLAELEATVKRLTRERDEARENAGPWRRTGFRDQWKCAECGWFGFAGNYPRHVTHAPHCSHSTTPIIERAEKAEADSTALRARVSELEADREALSVQCFLDQIDACEPEKAFWSSLDDHQSPLLLNGYPHRGEGGSTTLAYHGTKLLGISIMARDENNRTVLITIRAARQPGKEGRETL